MRHRLLAEAAGQRVFAVTLESGEPVGASLTALAAELRLRTCQISAIGGLQRATLGYFDPETKDFRQNEVDEQVEVLHLAGNIADSEEGPPKLHVHIVLGRHDATTRGGHLVEATVRPTLEAIIEESPTHLKRQHDPKTGLVLLQP